MTDTQLSFFFFFILVCISHFQEYIGLFALRVSLFISFFLFKQYRVQYLQGKMNES